MKNTILILLFLTSINVFTQEKSIYEKYKIQCEDIGRTIIDKNISTDLTEWYEGHSDTMLLWQIRQIERDIDNSKLDVTYSLTRISRYPKATDPYEYRLRFYNKETETQFGKISIKFFDRKNNLVDKIWVIVGDPLPCGITKMLPRPKKIKSRK